MSNSASCEPFAVSARAPFQSRLAQGTPRHQGESLRTGHHVAVRARLARRSEFVFGVSPSWNYSRDLRGGSISGARCRTDEFSSSHGGQAGDRVGQHLGSGPDQRRLRRGLPKSSPYE